MYRHVRVLVVCLLPLNTAAESLSQDFPKVVVISVIDESDEKLKGVVQWNDVALYHVLNDIPERHIDVTSFLSLSPQNVFGDINSRVIRPIDTVLFCYSGHGYDDLNDIHGTMLGTPGPNAVSLLQIRRKIAARRPRFSLFFVDCCQADPSGVLVAPAPPPKRPEYLTESMKALFFDPAGEVILNSSLPGEYSVARVVKRDSPGTLFTMTLFGEIHRRSKMANPGTWKDIFVSVRADVRKDFASLYPRGIIPDGRGGFIRQESQTVFGIRNGKRLE